MDLERINRILNLVGIETKVEEVNDKPCIFFSAEGIKYRIEDFYDCCILYVGNFENCPRFDFRYIYFTHCYPEKNHLVFSYHRHVKTTLLDGNVPEGSFRILF